MNRNNNLADKIESLSSEEVAEVEDFVEFLRFRGQDRGPTRAAASASTEAFAAVWDNPEDDAYDKIRSGSPDAGYQD